MQDKPLDKKYLQALSLLEAGNLTYREIAKQCSINIDTFYHLIEGDYKDSSAIQVKFTAALSEIHKRRDKEIRDLVKSNKKETHLLINRWVLDQKRRKKVGNKLMPTIVSVANALAKSTPNVEIGSFSYTKGLSAEDLVNEWKRLQGVGRGSANRSRVSGLTTGRERESLMAEGAGNTAPQEPEDTVLRAEPGSEAIPPSDNAD
jgi:hypothetical protein